MSDAYDNALCVGNWSLEPCCVFGGWGLAQVRWVCRESGWAEEVQPVAAELYPTQREAEQAVVKPRRVAPRP